MPYVIKMKNGSIYTSSQLSEDDLLHYGILGMKWGVRRYQNPDGSLTAAGKQRYGSGNSYDGYSTAQTRGVKVAQALGGVGVASAVLAAENAYNKKKSSSSDSKLDKLDKRAEKAEGKTQKQIEKMAERDGKKILKSQKKTDKKIEKIVKPYDLLGDGTLVMTSEQAKKVDQQLAKYGVSMSGGASSGSDADYWKALAAAYTSDPSPLGEAYTSSRMKKK